VETWLERPKQFDPSDLSTCQVWLDANDLSTIVQVGGDVSQWNDRSGKGNNFTQGTSASQPKTGTRTLSGRNAIDFDGSNDWMTAGDVVDPLDEDLAIFVVCSVDSWNVIGSPIAKSFAGAGNGRYGFFQSSGLNVIFDDGTAARIATESPAPTGANRFGYLLRRNATLKLFVNGVEEASVATTGTTSYNTTYGLLLGAYNNGIDGLAPEDFAYFNGIIAEVVILRGAFSNGDVDSINVYLLDKWGV
jgi:hypothetical protein